MKQQTYTASNQGNIKQLNSAIAKNLTGVQRNKQKSAYGLSVHSILLVAGLFSMGTLMASCGSLPKESAKAQSQQRSGGERGSNATPVDVAIARTGPLGTPLTYTGNTTPFRNVSLRSQVEARLLALNLDVGDRVERGQNVGQLDDALLLTSLKQAEAELAALKSEVARAQTQVSNARAEVERARLEVVQAEADSKRQQELFTAGAISQQNAEQARTEAKTAAQALRAAEERVRTEQEAVAAAQGRVVAQQAVVAQTKERRSYARLISPITGVVTEKVTEPGNLLQPGIAVLNIADFSRVIVRFNVSDRDLSKIQVGQSAQVSLDAFPNESLIGRVTRISPAANTTLAPVEVVIPNNDGKIGSGLLARVSFENQTSQRVVVSQRAIQEEVGSKQSSSTDNRNGTVFVITDAEDKTKVTARAVTLGNKVDGNVEILSGLQPGERYVARSGKPLKDGDAVVLSALSETAESTSAAN
ncbi:MAG: efflux RND transporter periplasmic adaptor subunit [Nodularia sp. CChRGM 3473]